MRYRNKFYKNGFVVKSYKTNVLCGKCTCFVLWKTKNPTMIDEGLQN